MMWGSMEERAKLFTVLPSDRTTGNGYKSKYRKFHLSTRKTLFTVRVVESWHRFSREAMETPSLEILKTWRSTATCFSWPCFEKGVGLYSLSNLSNAAILHWIVNTKMATWRRFLTQTCKQITQEKQDRKYNIIYFGAAFQKKQRTVENQSDGF